MCSFLAKASWYDPGKAPNLDNDFPGEVQLKSWLLVTTSWQSPGNLTGLGNHVPAKLGGSLDEEGAVIRSLTKTSWKSPARVSMELVQRLGPGRQLPSKVHAKFWRKTPREMVLSTRFRKGVSMTCSPENGLKVLASRLLHPDVQGKT